MTMRFETQTILALILTTAACTTDGGATHPGGNANLAPSPTRLHIPSTAGVGGRIPGGKSGSKARLFSGSGDFVFTGATTPGGATYTAAPYFDPSRSGTGPITGGGGSLAISINGTSYAAPTIDTIATTFTDDTGTAYVVLDGYVEYPDGSGGTSASVVVAFAKQSDFAIGATIALDGIDRVALFANGPATGNDPTLVAAAITGSLHITAGALVDGATVTAELQGDFGQIDMPTGGGTTPVTNIVAGDYTLAVDATGQVACADALVGHEADFAAVTLGDAAIVGGAVTVTLPSTSPVAVSGPAIQGSFATASLALDAVDTTTFAGITDQTGVGPAGTTLAGKFLAVDDGTATATTIGAWAGVIYTTADRSGTCTVSFPATLTR
jgi:hypothetical protein